MFPNTQSRFFPLLLAIVILALIVGIVYMVYSRTNNGELNPADNNIVIPAAGEISVKGTLVCLPHRDTSGPQTLECAYGLKDEEGRYFGLQDTSPTYENIGNAPMNVPVTVSGTFEPREDQKYQSIGVIKIEDLVVSTSSATSTDLF